MTECPPSVEAGSLHDRSEFPVDLVTVESMESDDPTAPWTVTWAMVREGEVVTTLIHPSDTKVSDPPNLNFEYWWEKEGNFYNTVVFHHWVRSKEEAAQIVGVRIELLSTGEAQSISVHPASPELQGVLEKAFPEMYKKDEDEPMADQAEPDDEAGWSELELQRLRETPRQVREALVWRLLSEVVRRHPKDLWIHVEGGGQYFRINLCRRIGDELRFVVCVNAQGINCLRSGEVAAAAGDPTVTTGFFWPRVFCDEDPRAVVREFERWVGLAQPTGPLPPSTRASLAIRWTAAFLNLQIGGRFRWTARSRESWSGDDAWLATVPQNPLQLLVCTVDPPQAVFVLSPEGDLWGRDGSHLRLQDVHRSKSSMTRLLVKTAEAYLP